MNVYLNRIDGIDDALVTLLVTKRKLNRTNELNIRQLIGRVSDDRGFYLKDSNIIMQDKEELDKRLALMTDIGPKHITCLKFIDFSCTVYGLHRAGQDDWDAHAMRFNNRIIRNSTRAAAEVFGEGEVSDFYKDKIIPTAVAMEEANYTVPDTINVRGSNYVRTVNGYIRSDVKDDQDVKRGLYMLSIPSDFIFRCDLASFAHVYKQRRNEGHANPEVKQCCESIVDALHDAWPFITREWLDSVEI